MSSIFILSSSQMACRALPFIQGPVRNTMISGGKLCCQSTLRSLRHTRVAGDVNQCVRQFATSCSVLGKDAPAKTASSPTSCSNSDDPTVNRNLRDITDLYVICNHGLPDIDTIQCTSSENDNLSRYSSCGQCNILGYTGHTDPGLSQEGLYSDKNGYHDSRLNIHGSTTIYGNQSGASWINRSLSHHRTMGAHHSGPMNNFTRRNLSMYSPFLAAAPSDANWIVLRSMHTSRTLWKEESKAEKTVKALKSSTTEKKVDEKVQVEEPEKSPVSAVEPVKTSALTRIKKKIVHEAKHYYNGFRLLFMDFRICTRLLWQVLNGKNLSRRERKQMVRTTADFFRLVPFSVFIIIPFMEFLLPVALKLFPGMLPSTFKEEDKEKEKFRKNLKLKLEMAKFLQDTIEETALQRKGAKGDSVQEFSDFLIKVRESGGVTSNEEIIKYSKLFEDEITLDNLTHGQLNALCKLVEIPTVGTSNFLRFQLRVKMRQLEADDKMILKEGLDSLAVWELQEASRARGMRAMGVPVDRLKQQLQQWLDLHLNNEIPTSLLLLSRTLFMPDEVPTEEQLKATIQQLPETTAGEAKVKISEVTGDRIDNTTKLEIIKQEEAAIQKEKEEIEKEEKAKEEELKKKSEEEEIKETLVLDEVMKDAAKPIDPSIVDAPPAEARPVATALEPEPVATEQVAEKETEAEKEEIRAEDLEKIEEVIEAVAAEKKISVEQMELEELKEDVTDYKEAIADLKEVVVATGSDKFKPTKSAVRLTKRVDSLVTQLEGLMDDINKDKAALIEDIEVKEVKIKRSLELKEDADLRLEVQEQIEKKKESLISMNELLLGMRRIQKVPDDDKLQKIAQVLDEDQDGKIDVNDALRVIELLGQENVKLSTDQITEIMGLLRQEEQIEKEEKEIKAREKQEKSENLNIPPEETLVDKATDLSTDDQVQKKDELKQ